MVRRGPSSYKVPTSIPALFSARILLVPEVLYLVFWCSDCMTYHLPIPPYYEQFLFITYCIYILLYIFFYNIYITTAQYIYYLIVPGINNTRRNLSKLDLRAYELTSLLVGTRQVFLRVLVGEQHDTTIPHRTAQSNKQHQEYSTTTARKRGRATSSKRWWLLYHIINISYVNQ